MGFKEIPVPYLVDEDTRLFAQRDLLDLEFSESLSLSWCFYQGHAFLSILLLNLGLWLLKTTNTLRIIPSKVANPKMLIFWTLIQVIFFPVAFTIFAKIWEKIVEFLAGLFLKEKEDLKTLSQQVVRISLSAHPYYLIPVFGPFVFHMAFLIYLFAGLKYNLGLGNIRSLIVLLSPIFFLGVLCLLFLLLLVTIIIGSFNLG
jgi:hypothetical protein